MVNVEEYGIILKNVDEMMKLDNLEVKCIFGFDGLKGMGFGICDDWSY